MYDTVHFQSLARVDHCGQGEDREVETASAFKDYMPRHDQDHFRQDKLFPFIFTLEEMAFQTSLLECEQNHRDLQKILKRNCLKSRRTLQTFVIKNLMR